MGLDMEIVVNGIAYVPKAMEAPKLDGMKYCIVRTYSAGVFACYVESRDGKEVVMRKARRLYYWEGAATLSELAMNGVKKPESCKFPEEVERDIVTEAIEIIDCTAKAKESIAAVPVWRA